MRAVAITTFGLLAVLFSGARAEEIVCSASATTRTPDVVEWIERANGYEQHGARMVVRDRSWEMDDTVAVQGTVHAECGTCRDGQIADAFLWFGLAPNNVSIGDLERKIASEAVAERLRFPPFALDGAEFSAMSDAVPAAVGELVGRARIIGIKLGDQSGEIIALAVARGCLSFFAVMAGHEPKIGLDRLNAFVQAIGVDFYKPAPITVAPLTGLPLGDRFRPEDWEK